MQPSSRQTIRSFHAHLYFLNPAEKARALALRDWIAERFVVELGTVHDTPIGPHDAPMYQVAFDNASFASFVPWLMLNHQGLSVLIHPNTGRDLDDHTLYPLWLGQRLPVRTERLRNEPQSTVGTSITPNTAPRLGLD